MRAVRSIFSTLVEATVEFFEAFKGERLFKKQTPASPIEGSYKAITDRGSHIEIFCKEIEYRITYAKWWVPDERLIMYRVHCVCSDDTPDVLKLKLSDPFVVSQLLHPWSSRVTQKKAVISSYIDLILSSFNDTLGS
jgi:hypothetical protein